MIVRRGDQALPTLEKEGIPASEIDLTGLPRRISPAWPGFAFKLLGSLRLLRRILKDFHTDAVVGMGGYLTFPTVLSAALRGIPRAVHESNAVLGLANKMCGYFGAELFWGLMKTGSPFLSSEAAKGPGASTARFRPL